MATVLNFPIKQRRTQILKQEVSKIEKKFYDHQLFLSKHPHIVDSLEEAQCTREMCKPHVGFHMPVAMTARAGGCFVQVAFNFKTMMDIFADDFLFGYTKDFNGGALSDEEKNYFSNKYTSKIGQPFYYTE